MLDGIVLTTEAVLESVAMVTWEGMSSTTKSGLELVAMGMERGVAMTTILGCYGICLGCYGDVSWLLWEQGVAKHQHLVAV